MICPGVVQRAQEGMHRSPGISRILALGLVIVGILGVLGCGNDSAMRSPNTGTVNGYSVRIDRQLPIGWGQRTVPGVEGGLGALNLANFPLPDQGAEAYGSDVVSGLASNQAFVAVIEMGHELATTPAYAQEGPPR